MSVTIETNEAIQREFAAIAADPELSTDGVEIVEREHPAGHLRFEQLPAGAWRTQKGTVAKKDRRRYLLDGDELPSVSSATGTLSAEALIYWAEDHGMRGAVEAERRGLFRGVAPEEFIRVARANGLGAEAVRDDAADRGKAIHAGFEGLARTGAIPNPADYPEAWRPWLQGAMRAWLALRPEAVEIEHMVCHPELGYAGRLDLIAVCDDVAGDGLGRCLTLVDYKTGKGKVYDRAHYQTRLYEIAARYEGLEIPRIIVVGIDDEGGFDPVPCEATDEDALGLLFLFNSRKGINARAAASRRARKKAAK